MTLDDSTSHHTFSGVSRSSNFRIAEDVADLDKLGGLQLVIAELDRPEEELRTTAAWVLGKACQNNLVVQKQVCANLFCDL